MTGSLVEINGKAVQRITYRDQPVVTLPMVDDLHERSKSTARQTFNRHKKRMIEGEDFFYVSPEEWKPLLSVCETYSQNGSPSLRLHEMEPQTENTRGGYRGEMVFLTETGYLMLVKVFDDDLSWRIQRMLVRNYFAARFDNDEPAKNFNFNYRRHVDLRDTGALIRTLGVPDSDKLRLIGQLHGLDLGEMIGRAEKREKKKGSDGKLKAKDRKADIPLEVFAARFARHVRTLMTGRYCFPGVHVRFDEQGRSYLAAKTRHLRAAICALDPGFFPEGDGANHTAGLMIDTAMGYLEDKGWRRDFGQSRGIRVYFYHFDGDEY